VPSCIYYSSRNQSWPPALPFESPHFEKTMQTRSTTEEYVELAETCLAESRRTLDRRASAMLRIMARRYLQEAERLDEVKRVPQEGTEGAES
jgi:Lon protease-like protein